MDDVVITLNDVCMEYTKYIEKIDSLKELFIKSVHRRVKRVNFLALESISLDIKSGEKIGVIGPNGAGKSTLLKIISGVIKPSSGTVKVNGSIAPLLDLGAGFDPELSGHDNIYLYSAILGRTQKEIKETYDEIVAFAELDEFLYSPVKNYSSGMRARLGFSIASQANPDILIIDEILGVGDRTFKEKSSEKINGLISGGTTVLIVSHNMSQIRELTEKVLWLKKGKLMQFGPAKEVCGAYAQEVRRKRKRKENRMSHEV